MPYVRVELIEGRTEDQKAELAQSITDAIATKAGVPLESIIIVFEDVRKQNWAHAGKLVSQNL